MEGREVLRVVDALTAAGVDAGMTGGWGIDALLERQTRDHGDVDLAVAAPRVDAAIAALAPLGYRVVVDQRPARIELRATEGRVDLHPVVWQPDGSGIQTGFGTERFVYPPGSLSAVGSIVGRSVACATPELQVIFHLGYPPSAVDRHDLAALAGAFDLELPPPFGVSRRV